RQKTHHRARQHRLAGARFTDHAEDLVTREDQARVRNGLRPVGPRRKVDGQVPDVEDRVLHQSLRSRGFSASLRPSPTRLIASTVTRIATPGIAQSHHARCRKSRAAPTMNPQLITFGSERPRNDSADSVRIAVATSSDPVTMIHDTQLGRIWRTMTRTSLMPI